MSDRLPALLDLRRAVASASRFEGRIPVAKCKRLSPLLRGTEGTVSYRLRCGVEEDGRSVIRGAINSVLTLSCQRCNGRLDWPVDADVALALVDGIEEASMLPDEYEPRLVDAQPMCSIELIEDELILSLPQIPRHAEGGCIVPRPEYLVGNPVSGGERCDAAMVDETARPNPFAALIALKSNS